MTAQLTEELELITDEDVAELMKVRYARSDDWRNDRTSLEQGQ